ncbi:hypothetical protein [Micromonospora sp. ATCC 39149]|uniref:Uncharacterized protein n=1 Tax=Micromonospora carbonacea TaxID=47853 RepID=A0A7D5Y775_9ACTN|nr:hypothetical protein [Micromonospora sp. ATCC 39149]QLK00519.1 hypothetical protein HZU44_11075 [Micromonospora carbonacea]
MLPLKAKIAASGLLAAAAVVGGVGATPASAATETVTVTIQVIRNSVPYALPSVLYSVGDGNTQCAGRYTPLPTIEVVAPKGAMIRLFSVSGCYSGLGGAAHLVADATKTVQVEL